MKTDSKSVQIARSGDKDFPWLVKKDGKTIAKFINYNRCRAYVFELKRAINETI